jgi:DNA-directed RNA polymerase sigma subunit (sigma70/sigma32)
MVGKKLTVEQPNMTHQAIADYFGISRAAVADMENNALRKVKKALEKKGFTLKDFFGE